ncbi:hypothetical protein Taro_045346 [Colocasia esculenta]|uniref:Uncharacterized protein n=1 Tax=Colocasia esculenta TaxID=4460 RepID=A0A843X023_COLES|nr:hypothetical protein [Colocasia esculenta]
MRHPDTSRRGPYRCVGVSAEPDHVGSTCHDLNDHHVNPAYRGLNATLADIGSPSGFVVSVYCFPILPSPVWVAVAVPFPVATVSRRPRGTQQYLCVPRVFPWFRLGCRRVPQGWLALGTFRWGMRQWYQSGLISIIAVTEDSTASSAVAPGRVLRLRHPAVRSPYSAPVRYPPRAHASPFRKPSGSPSVPGHALLICSKSRILAPSTAYA